MSYILDAVRKAEEERRQSQSAGVRSLSAQSMQMPEQRNYKYWLVGFSLIAVTNIGLWFVFSQDNEAPDKTLQVDTVSPPVQRTNAAESVSTISSQLETQPPAKLPTRELPMVAAPPAPAETSTQRQKLWQASAQAQTAINALEFSFHVYSSDETRRTIIINKQRMREGDRISDFLTLNEITETGVLLAFEDSLIEVEILEQW